MCRVRDQRVFDERNTIVATGGDRADRQNDRVADGLVDRHRHAVVQISVRYAVVVNRVYLIPSAVSFLLYVKRACAHERR